MHSGDYLLFGCMLLRGLQPVRLLTLALLRSAVQSSLAVPALPVPRSVQTPSTGAVDLSNDDECGAFDTSC
jgi:hypothetical protein